MLVYCLCRLPSISYIRQRSWSGMRKKHSWRFGSVDSADKNSYVYCIPCSCDSCLGGDDYVSRAAIRENSLCEKLFSLKSRWHWIGLFYTWLVHIMIFIGLLLSTALSFRQKVVEQNMLVGRIAVFGVFLFLSIWECNSRYLFTLTPIMILTAADGFFMLYDRIVKRET